MNRYVVKNGNEWKVVNAGYKRSIKNFKTQQAAIDFARGLIGTESLMVQGRGHKFIRHFGHKDNVGSEMSMNLIPKYVMKHSEDYKTYMEAYKWRMVSFIGIIFLLIGLLLMFLWIMEGRR